MRGLKTRKSRTTIPNPHSQPHLCSNGEGLQQGVRVGIFVLLLSLACLFEFHLKLKKGDFSKLIGVAIKNVRKRSKKRQVQTLELYHLIQMIHLVNASIAKNKVYQNQFLLEAIKGLSRFS